MGPFDMAKTNPDKLKILHYPHPALKERATAVRRIDDELVSAAERMQVLMREAEGIGLAAPQVGISNRFVVVRMPSASEEEIPDEAEVYINPVIVETEGAILEEEGCLSVPGLRGKVRRANKVVVAAYNLEGKEVRIEATGLAARLWQHEIDHLNGELFIEKLSPASRLKLAKELKELEREFRGEE